MFKAIRKFPTTQLCLYKNKYRFYKTSFYENFIINSKLKYSFDGIYILPKCSFHASSILFKNRPQNSVRPPIVFDKKAKKGKVVNIWKNMTVRELANQLNKTLADIFDMLFYDGHDDYDSPGSAIDDLEVLIKCVKLTGHRYIINHNDKKERVEVNNDVFRRPPADEKDLVSRPAVVTIMGHVDHGKTTLLDCLRNSSIVDSEFGGITQHIGAFEVKLPSGEQVTFLDTPGHAAFSAMRARGANATDIVVLVVAADDGVSPQTIESINMAREANVSIIVAINKIDKVDADIPRTKDMLLNEGIQLEEQGGDVQAVEISALKGTNIDLLVDALVTQAELINLKSDPKGFVEAITIESKMEHGRGKLATCVIQRGTLRKGAILVAGTSFAKVRNLFNDSGKVINKATLGTPVQVIGWRDLPSAGDEILEVSSESRANEVINYRKKQLEKEKMKVDKVVIQQKLDEYLKVYKKQRDIKLAKGIRRKMFLGRPPLEKLYKVDLTPRFCIVLKGDVDGSLEAILDVLETYQSDICPMDILSYGVGPVSQSDIEMANNFQGFVYAFNTGISNDVKHLSRSLKVTVRQHNIIYRLVETIKEDISKKLPKVSVQENIGEAIVQSEFIINEKNKKVPVAGCRCFKGQLKKDLLFQLVRNQEVIFEGPIESMRHLKNEVTSINKDVECGLRFEDSTIRFQSQDKIICYRMVMKEQRTDWNPPGF